MRSASSKKLWLLLSAAAAFGVLAWSAQQQPQPVPSRIASVPAIRAADAPLPAIVARMLRFELGTQQPGLTTEIQTVCTPAPCPAGELARATTELAQRQDAVRPAKGSPPRVVATLGNRTLLIAWKNRSSELCLVAASPTAGSGSIFGPCVHDHTEPCTLICFMSDGGGTEPASLTYLLAGTVSSEATELRVTTERARTTYPLRGPLVPGTDSRVLMLDLGRDDWRVLELLRGTTVIDSRTMSAPQIVFEDCQAAHPAMNDLKACVQGAVPLVPSPFP